MVRHNNECLTFVNNLREKNFKTLTPEIMDILLDSPVTGLALDRYRKYGLEDSLKSLPAIRFNVPMLCAIETDATEDADAASLFARAKDMIRTKLGMEAEDCIAMAYRSPAMGLVLVLRRRSPQEQTLQEEVQQWEEILEMPINPSCWEQERLYLLASRSDIFHYNAQMLFSPQKESFSADDFMKTPPPLPKDLPESISTIIAPVPDNAKPAVTMAVFSALRIFLGDVEFLYIDNTSQPPCFMNLTIADSAAGKSAVRRPLQELLYDIQQEDMQSREKFEKWRQECSVLSANQQRPPEPTNAPIRIVQTDMTNPALVKLSKRSAPFSLYSRSEEIEHLYRLKNVSEIVRSAFDSEMYGQERVGAGSVCEVTRLMWSFNLCSTPGAARKSLKNDLTNGMLSRLCLGTIIVEDTEWGDELPVFGEFGEEYRKAVSQYTRQLSAAHGAIDCPQAREWALREKKRQLDRLKMMDAKHMLPFLWRSLLMGFWRASMLWLMHGKEWTEDIEQLASWSVSYDMWVKMYYFSKMIESQSDSDAVSTNRPTMLLTLLPQQFTREDVRTMRASIGKSVTPTAVRNAIATWTHRGFIRFDKERQRYEKTNEYASVVSQATHHH